VITNVYKYSALLGLLKAAIRDPDPVVFLENELVYGVAYPVSDQVLDKNFTLPIGKAKIMRPGKHITIVAHSKAVENALEAANELAGKGIEAEVVNLRSLRPMDTETIFKSVQKTHHLVTVEQGWPQSGKSTLEFFIMIFFFLITFNLFFLSLSLSLSLSISVRRSFVN
jgi:pyruvate dehydrogenase E1 component beta subunit